MTRISLACLLAALPFSTSAANQHAQESILCHGTDNTTIRLELWKPSQFDVALHCLKASFAPHMVACAPEGGWGLGSDPAMTELKDVTNDWNTAHQHEMGKVIASAGKRGVRITAHVGTGISSNLMFEWKFAYDRRSDQAIWSNADGSRISYTCGPSG